MSVPKLRFPEFEGEWVASKAGEAFKNSKAKGEAGLPLYSVTMDRGLVRRDSLERHMHGDAADETNLRAQAGDIVYNMMRMWQGAAGIAETECMVSPAYVVLSPRAETSSDFFNYRIENARMLYLLWAYSHGLTSDRLRLYFADFARIPMRQPSLSEQKKIAAFLGAVDAKIAALRERRDGLERYKRGLMQALFSQRLRFTKKDGTAFPDWEEKRLGEVAEVIGGGTPDTEVAEHWNGNVVWFTPSEIKTKYLTSSTRRISERGLSSSSAKLLPIGALVLSTRATVGDVGIATQVCATNQGFQSLVMKGKHFNEFWYYWLKHNKKALLRRSAGSTFLEIGKSEVQKLPVLSPHPDEQAKIAEALSALDTKIAAVTGQFDKMHDFKKGLLQQMFV